MVNPRQFVSGKHAVCEQGVFGFLQVCLRMSPFDENGTAELVVQFLCGMMEVIAVADFHFRKYGGFGKVWSDDCREGEKRLLQCSDCLVGDQFCT